ncbi:class I SAM-dependent methyltransferase [Kitasatospora herbaricolor]|uniref:Class I SAM-dependent methyltransferase n=1 Tax=Kitasatospora herbaricolor TaxID=68217 RepID=A0ABZ1WJW7_9ACTN|nr:class I SAM-dependent methyltransferase [Kitasatospora herbaricolor]
MTLFDESERRIWSGRARAYGDSFAKLCAYPVERLLDAAGVRAGTRVLDVGTGTGTVAVAACARGAKVSAVDAEPGMVDMAGRAAPSAEVRVAALPALPFADEEFDAVAANFVLNHVGRPREALAELRRVTRPGGRVAVTIWASPPAPGQALLGRAIQAAGVPRPSYLPALASEDDFPRTEQGLTDLIASAGLAEPAGETLSWNHRTGIEEWWSGPAAGVATIGQIVISQTPEVQADIKRQLETLSAEFTDPDGFLQLPHIALMASGRAKPAALGRQRPPRPA